LSKDESDNLLEYLYKHIANNHDFQVRHRWTVNGTFPLPMVLMIDVAIWDNRSAFHNITLDYKVDEDRKGDRVVSLGEKPYFDPNSTSRREALGLLESYFN
jgi:alpha-ketoglutarate-dependent taurine dioxygenase